MDEDYMETQETVTADLNNRSEVVDNLEAAKEIAEVLGYEESYEEDDGTNSFRGGRGRGSQFSRGRGRGPPPGWMNGPPPPMRFRGRGFGPGGPPMRSRGFFRGRGGPRFGPNNGPGFDGNWGPMGPPPGMMGGPPPYGPPPGMMPPGGPMGPPPNMMGQPPPFAGPPGMPPPNMPAPELWVETKSDEGKLYYYHSRTRETTWTRPMEGPTCKVITQAEMEAMSTAVPQMPPGMNGPQSMMSGPMSGPMGGPPMGGPMSMMNGMMLPPGVSAGPAQGSVPPFMTQPPPWIKDGNNKDKQDNQNQMDDDESPPGDMSQMTQANGGGYGGPWGNWGWPPPGAASGITSAAVPDKGAATQMAPTTVTGAGSKQEPINVDALPSPKREEIVIPPELVAAAAEWTTHRAPDGKPYYYNDSKKESVWEKPKPMKELEELQAKIAKEKGLSDKKIDTLGLDDKIEVIDVEAHAEAAAAAAAAEESRRIAELELEREREQAERERVERERVEKERAEREKADKEKAEKEKAKQDRSRPISSTPISGTPWCVVWTGDGRVFFYNPTANSSVWERPPQLVGRADVDKAVSQPPVDLQRKAAGATAAGAGAAAAGNGELKRAASDSEDSDHEPAKKTKTDTGKKCAGVIDAGKQAAVEAEIRAARERAVVPFEQRVCRFLQMLHESEVSAFSPWEKELHKIVFDSRYLLLTSKERKQVFDKYVRERAEEERKEKKNRLQAKKTAFRELMDEAKLHSKSSFTEFSSKHGRDDRFKGIEKARDREKFFNEYILEVRKKEKEDKEKKKEQVKNDFLALLKEKNVGRHTRWAEIKKKIDSDPRYKAVESSTIREDYFREYCKLAKDDRKKDKDGKEKERDRSASKKEKKDKDRDKEKDKDKDKDSKKDKKKEKGEEEGDTSRTEAEETAGDGEVEGEVEAEGETEVEESSEAAAARERDRQMRAQASIKEREKEVQRALATSLRDRDKEREYHKRDEAVQHFNALLADLVRNPDLTWREAKKQLKKDHRYKLAELLSKEDKERLFSQHISVLSSKRRDKLRALLTELGVTSTARWREVKDQLQQQPTAPVYASASQMEREFREYQRDKQSSAKAALRQLLLECRAITHRSFVAVKESPAALNAITDTLQHDTRYTALEHAPGERLQTIMAHLEELHKKGPPPPPTASEPTRRPK
ncbi:PREDICTED: transcription elongation regulator 1 isoform X1 [Papilio xuthus]|uniref:Transcription elongation regulator 1 isoform X1 n=1 Tax=Papilio xuthus TaxID=66420 RepID=A0AAJ7EEQ3_PAPXU|nr:PREDICTED: transcription elongation regulator 1 isoform X1 [Papilio xuthus]